MVIGAMGPWAKAFGFVSVSGTDGDGVIVLIAGLIVGGVVLLCLRGVRRWAVVVGVLAGLVGAVTSIYDLANIKSVVDNSGVVTVGWGLWLDAIASVSATVALLALAMTKRPTVEPGVPSLPAVESGTSHVLWSPETGGG